MKPRTLLVLLALVAGLGAFIWFYERELPGSEERGELADRLFRGLEAGEVSALVIESGEGAVRLERVPEPAAAGEAETGGGEGEEEDEEQDEEEIADELPPIEPEPEWRIAEPAALAGARADRLAVERLLDSLVALEKSRTMTGDEADRAAAGLEPPRAKVTFVREEDGEEVTLEIGAEVPASSNVLAAIAGAPEVHVVGGALAGDLERPPGDWRDREVFAAGRDEIERLTLAPTGGGGVVLVRRGEGSGEAAFWLDEPMVDRADASAVEQLLSDLTAVRAVAFADDPEGGLAALGLEPPRGVIEAGLAGGEPFRLEIGAETGGGWYGRAGGQAFEAAGMLPAALARTPAEWQSRSLSARRLYQIDRVTIDERGAAGLVLEREGPDWRRDGEPIAYTPVSDLLFAVTDGRAERLARREAARAAGHLAEPALSITLAGGDADGEAAETPATDAPASETVTLYPPLGAGAGSAEGEVPATVTGRDYALYLAPATARTIRESLDRLREAEPLPEEEPPAEEAGEDGDPIEIESEEG